MIFMIVNFLNKKWHICICTYVCMYGELGKKRACHGPKKRWRDLISGDLQAIGLKESWWLERCREGVGEVAKCRKKLPIDSPRTDPLYVNVP